MNRFWMRRERQGYRLVIELCSQWLPRRKGCLAMLNARLRNNKVSNATNRY